MDGESENPRNVSDGTFALLGKATFFGYFLWQDKESNSPFRAKAVDVASAVERRFALAREFISFAGPKETNQRKGPSPNKANVPTGLMKEFSDSPFHGSVEKRRTSMPAALRVFKPYRLIELHGRSTVGRAETAAAVAA